MSSIDVGARATGAQGSAHRAVAAPRRLWRRAGNIVGGFLLTGIFLALSAAAFPVSAVYAFIWWAQH